MRSRKLPSDVACSQDSAYRLETCMISSQCEAEVGEDAAQAFDSKGDLLLTLTLQFSG